FVSLWSILKFCINKRCQVAACDKIETYSKAEEERRLTYGGQPCKATTDAIEEPSGHKMCQKTCDNQDKDRKGQIRSVAGETEQLPEHIESLLECLRPEEDPGKT